MQPIDFPDLQVIESDLHKVWKEYSNTIQNEKPHLFNIIANRVPKLNNETEIIIEIFSQSQESEIKKEKENILNYLKNKLQNSQLKLITSIPKNNEPKITEAITVVDKLKAMKLQNPAFAKMCSEFNLELI